MNGPMDRAVSITSATVSAEQAGWRLDRALATLLPTLSRERLKGLDQLGPGPER
jgi:23S rRNA pseudouridine1911/1915/1917 synthase